MPFSRTASAFILDFINDKSPHKNVLILSGARQVGKSTLVLELLKNQNALILNLEKTPSIAAEIDRCVDFKDFDALLKSRYQFDPGAQILMIDEAQQSERLGSFVRFMKEDWPQATVILAGSLINELHLKTERRPVGRESFLELWPLSFKEFLLATEQNALARALSDFHFGDALSETKHELLSENFDRYLKVGGLPAVVSAYKEGKDYERLRADIFKSYEDDFIRYFSLEDVNLFTRCLAAVAANAGSPSKDSQVVRLDGPGYKKVAGIFARLEKWKLLIKVDQLGSEPEKNKFHPKRYLFDLGLVTDLRLKGLQSVSVKHLGDPVLRTPLGGLIENAAALALRIQYDEGIIGAKMSTQTEIDFVVKDQNGNAYPIECKASVKFKANHLSTLKTYLQRLSPAGTGYLLYGGPPLAEKIAGICVMPYYLADEIKRLIAEDPHTVGN